MMELAMLSFLFGDGDNERGGGKMHEPNIYLRQKELNLNIPDQLCIIGVGGIGTWVSILAAMVGVRKLILIDNDVVEPHNLNRLPFTMTAVGRKKTEVVGEFIMKIRPKIEVLMFDSENNQYVQELLKKDKVPILDCRDRLKYFTDDELQRQVIAKLSYDGDLISIIPHPNESLEKKLFTVSFENGYTIIPSYVIPPVMVAAIALDYLFHGKELPDRVVSFHTYEILEKIMHLNTHPQPEMKNDLEG